MSVIFINKLLRTKMEKNYLDGINTRIEKRESGYSIIYELNGKVGECLYTYFRLKGNRKPIRQNDFILNRVDMSPIIEELDKRYHFKDGDLITIRRQIMDDSLRILKNSQ